MVLLVNELAKWMITPKKKKHNTPKNQPNTPAIKVRPFSHVAKDPSEVKKWVTVNLAELGAPVVFDERTCKLMHDHDVSFYLARKRAAPFLHAVRLSPGPVQRRQVAKACVDGVVQQALRSVAECRA